MKLSEVRNVQTDRRTLLAHVDALEARVVQLEQWIKDLQSGMYVNCVYCGHRYGPGETTPVSMADALKSHIEICPKHPMSALRAAFREGMCPSALIDNKDETVGYCIDHGQCGCGARAALAAEPPQGGEGK